MCDTSLKRKSIRVDRVYFIDTRINNNVLNVLKKLNCAIIKPKLRINHKLSLY